MNTEGRRAVLPPGDYARPQPLATNGLVVRHYNNKGRVREYDFSTLPVADSLQRSFAALFAPHCVPEAWAAHRTSQFYWQYLWQFGEFLTGQDNPVADLDDLTAALLCRWRKSLESKDKRPFTVLARLLQTDPRLQSGPVADELARRVKRPPSSVQSYSDAEFRRIKAAARRSFRAALRRINLNAEHLERWQQGDFAEKSPDWLIGHALSVLAETGSMPEYRSRNANTDNALVLAKPYRRVFGGGSSAVTWQRLFLSRHEATSLGVLMMAEYGWNLSVIDSLRVPKASPDVGADGRPTYRVLLEKPRRGAGRHHESRNFTDDGPGSSGRLITQALQATRFARSLVERLDPGADRLIVWRTGNRGWVRVHADRQQAVGPFRFGISGYNAWLWGDIEGLGSPFQRGRRTVIAINRREPGQHSEDTYERKYALVDRRVQQQSIEVIAAGAEDAVKRVRAAMLVAEIRDEPKAGDVETVTADCSDPNSSPFTSTPERGCTASFLMCLACPNAPYSSRSPWSSGPPTCRAHEHPFGAGAHGMA